MLMNDPRRLTDDELLARIASLTGAAREATAALIAHLAELEARSLHLAQGFRSLYGYCRHVLHLSEHEAYNRMEAAHAARRFPVVLALLGEGHLHLTAVCLLAPRLRDEDHLALLGGAIHKSKREVEELLARWFPKPDNLSSVRKAPVAGVAPVATAPLLEPNVGIAPPASAPGGHGEGAFIAAPVAVPQALQPVSRPGRPSIAPLSADRYQVKFTATAATIAKLERAQELLSHAVPGGDVGEIFDRALDVLLQHAARQKHAATERPRRGSPIARVSRTIPAAVEREVWGRDDGRCAFLRCRRRAPL